MAGASSHELQLILLQLDADLRKLTATVQLLANSVAPQADAGPLPGPELAPASPRALRWVLRDHGWTLVSPDGKSLTLTTAEREFMTSLLAAPDHRMARNELHPRAQDGDGHFSHAGHESRGLDVMVSRLRRKAQLAGMRLPLRSVRRWGYMFTADADAE